MYFINVMEMQVQKQFIIVSLRSYTTIRSVYVRCVNKIYIYAW
jgi:hypothetical protein